ncbi:MAG: hypothetical protein EAZ53_13290 [Bacteroidetes bacterium]|nr:MAG: hypothetical protein EAZ53_13290 [Bacteroidota bacterium]
MIYPIFSQRKIICTFNCGRCRNILELPCGSMKN